MDYFALQELVYGNEIVKKGTNVSSNEKLDEIYPKMFAKKGPAERERETKASSQNGGQAEK